MIFGEGRATTIFTPWAEEPGFSPVERSPAIEEPCLLNISEDDLSFFEACSKNIPHFCSNEELSSIQKQIISEDLQEIGSENIKKIIDLCDRYCQGTIPAFYLKRILNQLPEHLKNTCKNIQNMVNETSPLIHWPEQNNQKSYRVSRQVYSWALLGRYIARFSQLSLSKLEMPTKTGQGNVGFDPFLWNLLSVDNPCPASINIDLLIEMMKAWLKLSEEINERISIDNQPFLNHPKLLGNNRIDLCRKHMKDRGYSEPGPAMCLRMAQAFCEGALEKQEISLIFGNTLLSGRERRYNSPFKNGAWIKPKEESCCIQ